MKWKRPGLGLVEKPGADVLPVGDKGRFAVTETVDDEYVFRASPPRNFSVTAPYFHSGKVWDLSVAVQIMAESQLGEERTEDETNKIVSSWAVWKGLIPSILAPKLPAETAATLRPTAEILQ